MIGGGTMTGFLQQIDNGLPIRDPELLLTWDLKREEAVGTIGGMSMVSENYFTFRAALRELPFVDCVGLHFEKDRLSVVELFSLREYSGGAELCGLFREHQKALEDVLGAPARDFLRSLFFTDKDDREYRWKFRRVTVSHRLWNRFGMEEKLEIVIRR